MAAESKKRFTPMEGVVWVLLLGLLGFFLLSSWGLFNNFVSKDARFAGAGWKVLGVFFFIIFAFVVFYMATGNKLPKQLGGGYIEYTNGTMVLLAILLVLTVGANTGFRLTAGNRGEQVSTFHRPDCKVYDKQELYDHYENFYHFKTDTALKNYLEKYNELPGINLNCSWIRNGEAPRSNAPRADENFEWHNVNSSN